MVLPLEGKIACITGSSGGIGEAIAWGLARAGAKVSLGARRTDKLEKVANLINKELGDGTVEWIVTDVTKREDVRRLAELRGPSVDIWVNNAGVMYYQLMHNCGQDEWDRMLAVNCSGTLNGMAEAMHAMLPSVEKKHAGNGGHIVNISSDASKRVFPALAVYCGTKAFIDSVSEGTRRELVGTGIRVTVIQPGDVSTDLVVKNTDQEGADLAGAVVGCRINGPRNSILDPKDIADAVLYAVTAPPHVAVNEILVEPRDQE